MQIYYFFSPDNWNDTKLIVVHYKHNKRIYLFGQGQFSLDNSPRSGWGVEGVVQGKLSCTKILKRIHQPLGQFGFKLHVIWRATDLEYLPTLCALNPSRRLSFKISYRTSGRFSKHGFLEINIPDIS